MRSDSLPGQAYILFRSAKAPSLLLYNRIDYLSPFLESRAKEKTGERPLAKVQNHIPLEVPQPLSIPTRQCLLILLLRDSQRAQILTIGSTVDS